MNFFGNKIKESSGAVAFRYAAKDKDGRWWWFEQRPAWRGECSWWEKPDTKTFGPVPENKIKRKKQNLKWKNSLHKI